MTENNRTEFEEEQTTTDFEEAVGSGQEDNEAVSEKQMEAPASKEESEESQGEPEESGDLKYMRLSADFQNFKRRVEKEKADIYKYANEKIALDIIEVMDNFERALTHGESCTDKQFAEGVNMIYKQLKGVLDKNNILEIPAENEEFNPNFHNAVMTEENPNYESGIVIQVLQKGYTLNGKVIRPSMVKVAQ